MCLIDVLKKIKRQLQICVKTSVHDWQINLHKARLLLYSEEKMSKMWNDAVIQRKQYWILIDTKSWQNLLTYLVNNISNCILKGIICNIMYDFDIFVVVIYLQLLLSWSDPRICVSHHFSTHHLNGLILFYSPKTVLLWWVFYVLDLQVQLCHPLLVKV